HAVEMAFAAYFFDVTESDDLQDLDPPQGYQVEGYNYLGRGSGGGGWTRRPNFSYRCAKCGDMMQASHKDYFNCTCNAMHLDKDAGRFGSQFGDRNILRYQKINGEVIDSLSYLNLGDTIE